jgi:D-serine deaminase-like pyridoxal phosphate-dependent protein
LAVGAATVLRPSDNSGPRADYFVKLQGALKAAGIFMPTLVIDQQRLDANITRLKADLPKGMGYRIVVKSLPFVKLVERIRARTGTDRLMTFNLPMLREFAQSMPDASQLLGKPLPVAAAQAFFAQSKAAIETVDRINWLIDTPTRLAEYLQLAGTVGRPIGVAIELDVGFHRGGQVAGQALQAMLEQIKEHPELRFAGTVGYDPHIPSVPKALGQQDREIAHAWSTYQAAKAQIRAVFGPTALDDKILNAAGSPTYRLYKDTKVANEVSVGSALVKPTDFDTELLSVHQPASFIATPVLKRTGETELPHGFGGVSALQRLWDRNSRQTIFIHGGHWLAKPVDPPGLQYNQLFGRSSNQEMLNAGQALAIKPDEFVFLRPTQSEAVFQQFGDIAVYDGNAIVERWPGLPASA